MTTDIEVVSEPLTYQEHGPHSFFRDHLAMRMSDGAAMERLSRHAGEMRVELEHRANPSRVAGQGGEFTLPLYLIDQFAVLPRPERVIAELATRFPLSRGVGKVLLPRLTAGTEAGAARELSADASAGLEDTQPSSEVVLVGGHVDTSLQLLEQSPPGASLDRMMFRDLTNAYDAALESQLTNGAGGKDELLGILNVAGRGEITYTPTVPEKPKAIELYQRLGEVFGLVSNNRKQHLEAWLMRGGRWAWIATGEDAQTRPLVTPFDSHEETTGVNPIGRMIGASVFITESIPKTFGPGGNQDVIVGLRASDLLLWEEPTPAFEILLDVLSGTLEVRMVLRAYAAFIPGRYPSSLCSLIGAGMIVPPNY